MLKSDPIFFRTLNKGKGRRRTVFQVENPEDQTFAAHLKSIDTPDWLHLERVGKDGEVQIFEPTPGSDDVPEEARKDHPAWLVIPPRRKVQLIANIDTDHPVFPLQELPDAKALTNESATIFCEFDGEDPLEIPWTLAEIVLRMDEFDGMFALDFGTTNSCFAYKRRRSGPDALERPPRCSSEIPSVIYFEDLSVQDDPRVLIGDEARLAILKNPSRIYAYCESIKRLLGSNQKLTILDARGRSASYSPEQIASFVVREIIESAQSKDLEGRRITRVLATFPTLFSPRRRRAVQDAILGGLRLVDENLVASDCLKPGERPAEVQERCDDRVELRVDEANAATFRHITGPLLEACFRFGRDQTNDVLTYDFGGGTIDVSYLRVSMERDTETRQTTIDTELLGVTGEPNYGGDNVSLELLRILRVKLAVEAAKSVIATDEAKRQASVQKVEAEKEDAFAKIMGAASVWAAEEEAAKQEPVEEEPDEFSPPPLSERLSAAKLIAQHAEVIVEAASEGILEHPLAVEGKDGWFERLSDLLREDAQAKKRPYRPDEAKDVDQALERFLPTRFARYSDSDPAMERKAKILYMDLWREANDRLKPLLVARCGGETTTEAAAAAKCNVQEQLERLARYAGVEPKLWNDTVTVSLAELERAIEPRIRRSITKARDVYRGAREKAPSEPAGGGLLGRSPAPAAASKEPSAKLTVLLAGNSSILPIVKRLFAEIFDGIDHEVVADERSRKTSVAQGAVEECLLAREFGTEGGGIHFRSEDFLERLPFSFGLYSRFLGFVPLFKRGASEGDTLVADAREFELITRNMEELPIYADYHDGAPVRYMGVFDFRRGEGRAATPDEANALPAPEDDGKGETVYRPLFKMLSDWEMEFVDPDSRRVYRLALEDVKVDPREDPFSGEN